MSCRCPRSDHVMLLLGPCAPMSLPHCPLGKEAALHAHTGLVGFWEAQITSQDVVITGDSGPSQSTPAGLAGVSRFPHRSSRPLSPTLLCWEAPREEVWTEARSLAVQMSTSTSTLASRATETSVEGHLHIHAREVASSVGRL